MRSLDKTAPPLYTDSRVIFLGKEAGFRLEDVRALLRCPLEAGLRLAFLADYGPQDALVCLCADHRLAVMPSLRENSPWTVAERLRVGIPFLASSVGGGKELAHAADRAISFCAPEAPALAERLCRALRGELPKARPAYARELGTPWQELLQGQIARKPLPPKSVE